MNELGAGDSQEVRNAAIKRAVFRISDFGFRIRKKHRDSESEVFGPKSGACNPQFCIPLCSLCLCGFFLLGCAGDKPETVQDRQDRLLKDPFNTKLDQKPRDISGGTLGELNRDEMRKDLNSVFNP